MNSIKELLHSTIEQLSDEEARQILELAEDLKKSNVSLTLRRLAIDPAFKVPSEVVEVFRAVEPIQGKGIAASRLLVKDR
jgi:hypothetical protein